MNKNKISEFTLGLIKPQLSYNGNIINDINQIIISNQFRIVKHKSFRPSLSFLENFYVDHKSKFFYNRLLRTMYNGGVIHAYILEHDEKILYRGAIKKWRDLIGPTKVYLGKYSHPDTLRSVYGSSDTRNCFHGSGSQSEAIHEIRSIWDDEFVNDLLIKNNNE